MALELRGVDEVLFFVDDVPQAANWIMSLLDKKPAFESENYCSFDLGFCRIGLHPSDEKTSSGVSGQVTYWNVIDLNQAISHFISHGCKLFRGPLTGVDGVDVCQMVDPFGNSWGLVQRARVP